MEGTQEEACPLSHSDGGTLDPREAGKASQLCAQGEEGKRSQEPARISVTMTCVAGALKVRLA